MRLAIAVSGQKVVRRQALVGVLQGAHRNGRFIGLAHKLKTIEGADIHMVLRKL